MRGFCSDLFNFPYLIMAASEREERGGAITDRGAERFQFGDTIIAQRRERQTRTFVYFVQQISPLKLRRWIFSQSAVFPQPKECGWQVSKTADWLGTGGRGEHVRFGWPYDHGNYDVTANDARKCRKFSKMAALPLVDTTFWGGFLQSFQL